MLETSQSYAAIPMLFACDEEGGVVNRLMTAVGTTRIDSMLKYKDEGVEGAARNAETIATDMRGCGFNMDFAPVADVWSNPVNAVIGLSRAELSEALLPLQIERYRAGQIFDWLHKKRVSSYEEMSNLPAQLRRTLAEDMPFSYPEAVSRRESEKDGTVKYLLSYPDGALVESVLMHYRHGTSLCLSSQVGCRMACRFCASVSSS